MAGVIRFFQWSLSTNIGPLNAGMTHSIQWNLLQHSEELYNNPTLMHLIFMAEFHSDKGDCADIQEGQGEFRIV